MFDLKHLDTWGILSPHSEVCVEKVAEQGIPLKLEDRSQGCHFKKKKRKKIYLLPPQNTFSKYLMKLLRRQTCPSGTNIICESFCSLIDCIIRCFCTYVRCVSSRGTRFELVLPVFCGNVETCSLPYVDIGLCPFG